MNWLEFIAALTSSLAWPVVALVIAVVLRKPLVQVIKTLRRVKYRELEAEFGEQIESIAYELAKEEVEKPLITSFTTPDQKVDDVRERVTELASISPRAAIVESWREIERLLVLKAEKNSVRTHPLGALIQDLAAHEFISTRTASILHDLRRLRNEAAHSADIEISEAAAREYGDVANRIANNLRLNE